MVADMTKRIIIADDNKIFREAVKDLLMFSDLEIIAEAGDGPEIIELVERLKPDILLLDQRMPEMEGIEVVKRLRKICPDLKIIMLTMYDNLSRQAIEAGANGFCTKVCKPGKILEGIESVLEGKTFICDK